MSKVIGVSGLIGTQDYLIPYNRTSTAPVEYTPAWRKTNYNGADVTDVSIAGLIPVQVTLNGKGSTFKYKNFKLGTAITTTDETQTLAAGDYAKFEEGVYYTNEGTGELFFCLAKLGDNKVTFKRGLLGTTAAGITTSNDIDVMNTLLLDSVTTAETLGVFTLTKGTAPLAANDTLSVSLDGVAKVYTMKATATGDDEIAVGADAAAQATNIATKLSADFPNWSAAKDASNNVKVTQKTGKGAPFTLVFSCTAATPANAFTHSTAGDTAGVATVYDSGYGFIIYKEMPRNLPFGQKVYPAYNYNVDGR